MKAARKLQIEEIKKGKWIEKSLLSPYGERLQKARVLGFILKKFIRTNYGHLLLHDGTAQFMVKAFSEKEIGWLRKLSRGQLVDCGGQLREWKGKVYLKLEFIRTIKDPNFLSLRLVEIAQRLEKLSQLRDQLINLRKQSASDQDFLELAKKKSLSNAKSMLEAGLLSLEEKSENNEKNLLKLIKKMSTDKGVEFERLLAKSELPAKKLDELLGKLLAKGVCFEPQPGRIKLISE